MSSSGTCVGFTVHCLLQTWVSFITVRLNRWWKWFLSKQSGKQKPGKDRSFSIHCASHNSYVRKQFTSKCNAHKLFFICLPFFSVFLLEHCQDFKLILRSKQLASVVVCYVITLVIELPNRIVYDEWSGANQCVDIGKMHKWQAFGTDKVAMYCFHLIWRCCQFHSHDRKLRLFQFLIEITFLVIVWNYWISHERCLSS